MWPWSTRVNARFCSLVGFPKWTVRVVSIVASAVAGCCELRTEAGKRHTEVLGSAVVEVWGLSVDDTRVLLLWSVVRER